MEKEQKDVRMEKAKATFEKAKKRSRYRGI